MTAIRDNILSASFSTLRKKTICSKIKILHTQRKTELA